MIQKINKLLALALVMLLAACTNWNYIDTGTHDPNEHAQKSIYKYLSEHPKDFSLAKALIDRAGLRDLYEGNDAQHPAVMLIAPLNYSIMAGMVRNNYATTVITDAKGNPSTWDFIKDINNIPVEVCRSIMLSYTFDKIYYRDAFPAGTRGESLEKSEGGEVMTSLNGNKVWFYNQKTAYGQFSTITINTIHGIEVDTKTDLWLPTTDIKVKNGVIHANTPGFIIKDLPMTNI